MSNRLNPQDHPSGTRFVHCTVMSTRTLLEATVVEWSPAGLVCIRRPHSSLPQWLADTDRDLMDVVEILPPSTQKAAPVDDGMTPDMPVIQTLSQLLRVCDVAVHVSVVDDVLFARLPVSFPSSMQGMLIGRVPPGADVHAHVEQLNAALARLRSGREAIGRDNAR